MKNVLSFLLLFPSIYSAGQFTFATDQDNLILPNVLNEDRNYTQGTSFTLADDRLAGTFLYSPIKLLAKRNGIHRAAMVTTFSLAATGFTPEDLKLKSPVVGDRPYSFLLFLSTSMTFRNSTLPRQTRFAYETFRMNYGMFGGNLGREFQSYAHLHLILGRPDPQGWGNQISEGGCPTILIDYSRFKPLVFLKGNFRSNNHSISVNAMDSTRQHFDIGFNFGGSVGYYDRMYSGLYMRLGWLRIANQFGWFNSTAAMGSAHYMVVNASGILEPRKKRREAFFYANMTGNIILRNSMLQGQRFWPSEYTLENNQVTNGVMYYEYGLGFTFPLKDKISRSSVDRNIQLLLKQCHRTAEFRSAQFSPRWHHWGGIAVTFPI